VRITERRSQTVDISRCVPGSLPAPRQDLRAQDGSGPVTRYAAIHLVPRRGHRYRREMRRPRFHERRPTAAPHRDARSTSNVRSHERDRTVICAAARRYHGGAPDDGRADGHHDRPVSGCLPTYVAIGGSAVTSAHAPPLAVPDVCAVDLRSPMRGRRSRSQGEA
jgi:hypothetical protein